MEILFRQRYPWAVLPYKQRVDLKGREADAMMYAENFRYMRRYGAPERCWPWRIAQEAGWLIPSPIDIDLEPVDAHEVSVAPRDRSFFSQSTGLPDLFPAPNGESSFAVDRHVWLKISEVKFGNGYAPMFAPDRDGFVNWRLGWEAIPPPDHILMVLPIPELEGVETRQAIHVLTHSEPDADNYGFTIAVRPLRRQPIARRQPVARLLAVHSSVLDIETEYEYLEGQSGA